MYSSAQQKALYDTSKNYLKGSITKSEQDQTEELRQILVYHEWRYYIENDPVISDFEYDQLYKMLEKLETDHPQWITPDSPTQRVSKDLTSDFQSVAHLEPMLSLDNSYNADDLKDFDKQVKKLAGLEADASVTYVVEPKFDGGSIALVYEDNLLVRGATRGDGALGEEITNNVRVMRSIPLKANFSAQHIKRVELRGEVLIRKDFFKAMNLERQKAGLSLFANARNTASGGLRMKDPAEVAKRGLEAFVYQVGFTEFNDEKGRQQLATHEGSILLLQQLGFKVPIKERKLCQNIDEVIAFCQEWEAKREGYPYEIDGMVVKVNHRATQELMGATSHHPRWAIAYKFKAKQATTKLLDVTYQVGKIGSITPVAKVDPVQLAGVTISSISLHNEDFIKEKDLRIGDTVLVERAGDVIPYIVKSMADLRDGGEQVLDFPKVCPINHTDTPITLTRVDGEAAWRCPTCVCGTQDLQRMIFHVSKDAMDIDGFGKSIVERFFQLGWIKDLADIYALDYDNIAALEGFGQKSAANLEKAIAAAKKQPLHRLLHSLSIHHLGKKVSKLIAAEINHALDLQNWTLEDFTNIKDVGPIVAQNVIQYFAQPTNIDLLMRMEANGVNLNQTEADQPKTPPTIQTLLTGKTILFTGTLQEMGRKEAQNKAEAAGAKLISAVSANLDILVAGEKAGSKLKKATALGTVEILTEAEFLERLGE